MYQCNSHVAGLRILWSAGPNTIRVNAPAFSIDWEFYRGIKSSASCTLCRQHIEEVLAAAREGDERGALLPNPAVSLMERAYTISALPTSLAFTGVSALGGDEPSGKSPIQEAEVGHLWNLNGCKLCADGHACIGVMAVPAARITWLSSACAISLSALQSAEWLGLKVERAGVSRRC